MEQIGNYVLEQPVVTDYIDELFYAASQWVFPECSVCCYVVTIESLLANLSYCSW